MNNVIISTVQELHDVLVKGQQDYEASVICRLLQYQSDTTEFWDQAAAIEIWGGSGSVFDQAFVRDPENISQIEPVYFDALAKRYQSLLLRLGELIIENGSSNRFVDRAVNALRSWTQSVQEQ